MEDNSDFWPNMGDNPYVINNKGDNSLVLMKNFSDAGNICI